MQSPTTEQIVEGILAVIEDTPHGEHPAPYLAGELVSRNIGFVGMDAGQFADTVVNDLAARINVDEFTLGKWAGDEETVSLFREDTIERIRSEARADLEYMVRTKLVLPTYPESPAFPARHVA